MRYVLAILACAGLFILYAVVGVALGWRHGGGMIPILILLAAMAGAWRAITKNRNETRQIITKNRNTTEGAK